MYLGLGIAVICLLIIEAVSFVIYRGNSFKNVRKFFDILFKRKSKVGDMETFTIRYTEHPFLGFSLNPDFKNAHGEKIHNKYGFRTEGDFEDIDKKNIVYCVGGSATYCHYIEKNKDTWPDRLEWELKRDARIRDIKVINGACGGWTSYQSLIRFSAWVDILKPKLVIIYHGKNDFAPFINGKQSEKEVFPDYGNVMHSLRFDALAKQLPFLAKFSYAGKVFYGAYINRKYMNVLWHVYGLKGKLPQEEGEKGIKRVGPREWEYMLSRYKAFASLCKDRKIPVLFVTQKVKMDFYAPYMEELNSRIKALEDNEAGCFVYDFAGEIGDPPGLLFDHVHFTSSGARICAESIKNYMTKNIDLFKDKNAREAVKEKL